MTRTDLTDPEWERLKSKLPSSKGKRGGQYKDHRPVLNGILWVLRTGAPWRDMPERYGKWKTCHDRLLRWRRQGVWERVLQALQGEAEAVGEVVWTVVSIDGTTVRAHQHAAGARRMLAQTEPPAAAEKGGSRAGRRGARSAAEAAGPSGAGQGLQLSEVPPSAALPRAPARHPGAERPAGAAAGQRLPGRST